MQDLTLVVPPETAKDRPRMPRSVRNWYAVGYGRSAVKAPKDARGTWFFLVIGGAIGLVLGILMSVTTDVPLAPELGLALGALVGWLSRRVSA